MIDSSRKEDYSKRLLLLEHQIEGLMRQNFMYEKQGDNSSRTMDYSALINEKENQIIQLEKKVTGIEGRLRSKDSRIEELEK